jgi:hypothetical protein
MASMILTLAALAFVVSLALFSVLWSSLESSIDRNDTREVERQVRISGARMAERHYVRPIW